MSPMVRPVSTARFFRTSLLIFALLSITPLVALAQAAPAITGQGLVIERERLMINDAGVQVGMMFVNMVDVFNDSEKELPNVELPLIDGYNGLSFMGMPINMDEVEQKQFSFVHRQPLKPGERRSYRFTYAVQMRLPLFVNREIKYLTESYEVNVPDIQMVLKADGLVDRGVRDLGNGPVHLYSSAKPLLANTHLNIEGKANVSGMAPFFWRWVALLGVPFGLLVAIMIRGQRLKRMKAGGKGPGGGAPRGGQGKGSSQGRSAAPR